MYVETDVLRSLDTKVDPYFKDFIRHFPVYFVSDSSMRGFDLSCLDEKIEINMYIFSAFECKRHMT